MSVYRIGDLRCGRCGHGRPVKVVDSANPVRHPPFLDALLARSLNRFRCTACGHVDGVERPMLWTDVPHGLVAAMLPSSDRPRWSTLEVEVGDTLRAPVRDEGPPFVRSWGARASIRVVFGLEELRDKAMAHRSGLDDRVVELLKLPYVDMQEASAPVLEAVDEDGLHLATAVPADSADPEGPTAREIAVIPWDDYHQAVAEQRDAWLEHPGLFAGTWVHCLRAPFPPEDPYRRTPSSSSTAS